MHPKAQPKQTALRIPHIEAVELFNVSSELLPPVESVDRNQATAPKNGARHVP
jgi:hypothetical protein